MMTRVLTIGRWLLLVWGGVSFVAVLVVGVIALFVLRSQSHDRVETASPQDVRFVLNWCGLGEERIEQVIHGYVSARSGPGDYLDAHAIRISRVDLDELTSAADDRRQGWHRGDQLPKVLDDAVSFGGGAGPDPPWVPAAARRPTASISPPPLTADDL